MYLREDLFYIPEEESKAIEIHPAVIRTGR